MCCVFGRGSATRNTQHVTLHPTLSNGPGEPTMADSIAKRLVVSVALLAALLLTACGGGEEPTPTPTKTPLPAAAAEPATPQAPEPPAPTQSQAAAPTELPTSAPPAAEPTATPAPVVEQIGTVMADQLNIRSEPNTSGAVVRMVLAGQTFTVVGKSDDGQWLQVAENGTPVGWAAAEFVSVEERVVQAPATAGRATHNRRRPNPANQRQAVLLPRLPWTALISAPRLFSGGGPSWRKTT